MGLGRTLTMLVGKSSQQRTREVSWRRPVGATKTILGLHLDDC
jgi:hypothetical protein